jgi:leucyl aminopeptidase
MRHALNSESWKNLLPDASFWLDKVSLDLAGATVPGAHHVVAAKSVEDEKQAFALNAPALPDATRKALDAAVRALGWRPAAGSVHVTEGGATFTIVPQTSVKVGAVQAGRQLGLDAAKALKDLRLGHVAFCEVDGLQATDVFEGYVNGVYNHVGFKGARKRDIERFPQIVSLAGSKLPKERLAATLGLCRSQLLARFLQDAPPNYLNPVKFAEIAKDVAREAGVKCTLLDKEQMTQLGMGSFLSVSDGSVTEPRLIAIEIEGEDNGKCVALVGKGLTFDSGGVSIKPSAGMEEMKYDMSGGAAVLGAAHFLAHHKPPVKVVCVIGATENLVSGNATRPSDIVRAHNGKTIEVLNTDAEGRLVLADVLSYTIKEHKPDLVIDIATLTGAVLMGLGCVGAAVMSTSQATADYVIKCGNATGEPLWQLPLWPELEKEVKSEIADLKNIAKSSVKAGTIMGAMFLKEFVGDTKWAHLDIAGTGWNCQAVGFPQSGSAAFGLRTLVHAVQQFTR